MPSLYIAGAGLVAMSCIVLWQVFVRFVLNWGQAWTELTSIMIMSWFIFLGAAVGVRENYHLGFDVLLYVLPKGIEEDPPHHLRRRRHRLRASA